MQLLHKQKLALLAIESQEFYSWTKNHLIISRSPETLTPRDQYSCHSVLVVAEVVLLHRLNGDVAVVVEGQNLRSLQHSFWFKGAPVASRFHTSRDGSDFWSNVVMLSLDCDLSLLANQKDESLMIPFVAKARTHRIRSMALFQS